MRDSHSMTALRASGLLDLQPSADQDAVRQAYLDLVRVWHPDWFTTDERLREKATAKLAELNAAYEVLKHPAPAFQFAHAVPADLRAPHASARRRVRVQVVRRRPSTGAHFFVSAIAAAAAVLTIIAVLLSGFADGAAEGATTNPRPHAAAATTARAVVVAPPVTVARPVVSRTSSILASSGRARSPFSRDLDQTLARSLAHAGPAPAILDGSSAE